MRPFSTITTEAYTLQYRPDRHILILRWLRPHALPELQHSYRQLLAPARQHGCARWLLDARREGPIRLEATHWLVGHFLPEAVQALAPHTLCMAALSSPARLEQAHTDATVAPDVARALAPTQPYQATVVLTEADALAWLAAQPR